MASCRPPSYIDLKGMGSGNCANVCFTVAEGWDNVLCLDMICTAIYLKRYDLYHGSVELVKKIYMKQYSCHQNLTNTVLK